jgi:ABC-type phosphate transport system substrate-binding protein
MKNISYHRKKSLLLEKIGKVVVWVAAGITIGVLFWITGYILYKGIISDTKNEYIVVGKGNKKTALDEKGYFPVVFIVHPDIRTQELDINMIIDFFTGEERFWLVSEQGLKVRPFSFSPSHPLGRIFHNNVIGEHEEYVRSTVFVDSDEEMIRMVSSTIGGIGYISTNSPGVLKKAKAVNVRSLSLLVNSEVLSIKDNIKLNFLTEEHVRLIFTSKVTNWQEVGGIDLPIIPCAYSENTYQGREFIENVLMKSRYGETVHIVSSYGELVDEVNRHTGAIGFSPYLLLKKDYPGQFVKVERREIKPNISLPQSFLRR